MAAPNNSQMAKNQAERGTCLIVERIGIIFWVNRSLYDKSMKFGTE